MQIDIGNGKSIEVPVPYFIRDKAQRNWVGLLDENTVVTIYQTPDMTVIKNMNLKTGTMDLMEAMQSYHSCTETEFLEKFDEVQQSLYLNPILKV